MNAVPLAGVREKVTLVECPRDAMQGWKRPISTEDKIEYINALLKVGFDTIDFGSFVSPKAIPQMADTKEVLQGLETGGSASGLLAIVANTRGAHEALAFEQITQLGFPFSISPTFQQRNTNKTIEASLATVDEIQELCVKANRQLVLYLSMAFGNPYGDAYNADLLLGWADRMVLKDIQIISLADTVGVAKPEEIASVFSALKNSHSKASFGVHLHSDSRNWQQKLDAAYRSGCRRFDGAMLGVGGCPMADDDLVGNMATEKIINFLVEQGEELTIDQHALEVSLQTASKIFSVGHA